MLFSPLQIDSYLIITLSNSVENSSGKWEEEPCLKDAEGSTNSSPTSLTLSAADFLFLCQKSHPKITYPFLHLEEKYFGTSTDKKKSIKNKKIKK